MRRREDMRSSLAEVPEIMEAPEAPSETPSKKRNSLVPVQELVVSGRLKNATKRLIALRRAARPEDTIEEDCLEEQAAFKPPEEETALVQETSSEALAPTLSVSTHRYVEPRSDGVDKHAREAPASPAELEAPRISQTQKVPEVEDSVEEVTRSNEVPQAFEDLLQQYHEQREALHWRPSEFGDQDADFPPTDADFPQISPFDEFDGLDFGAALPPLSWGQRALPVQSKKHRSRPRKKGYPVALPDVHESPRHPHAVHGHSQLWVSDLRPSKEESSDKSELDLLQSQGSAILASLKRREAELLFQTCHPARMEFREHRKSRWTRPVTKDLRSAYRETWSLKREEGIEI